MQSRFRQGAPGKSDRKRKRPAERWPFRLLLSGSTTWTRTRDPVINSHLLYQLSYRGMRAILLIGKGKSSERLKKISRTDAFIK